jgi:hypothetical protein
MRADISPSLSACWISPHHYPYFSYSASEDCPSKYSSCTVPEGGSECKVVVQASHACPMLSNIVWQKCARGYVIPSVGNHTILCTWCVRFGDLTAVPVKGSGFGNITPFKQLKINRCVAWIFKVEGYAKVKHSQSFLHGIFFHIEDGGDMFVCSGMSPVWRIYLPLLIR